MYKSEIHVSAIRQDECTMKQWQDKWGYACPYSSDPYDMEILEEVEDLTDLEADSFAMFEE